MGDEVHPPYERPYLSKGLLLGTQRPEDGHIFPATHWQEVDVQLMLGRRAVAIDLDGHAVELDDGHRLPWDRLLFCTGGRARILPLGNGKNAAVLRSVEDALALRGAIHAESRIAVVGGGWIGLEIAAAARQLGAHVVVVEQAVHVCQRVLPAQVAQWLEQLHRTQGVTLLLGTGLDRVSEAGGSTVLHVHDGSQVQVDQVVCGIGMVPNDDLAREAGLDCQGGIVVDRHCKTSHPLVFAAGDVAVTPLSAARGAVRLESWQNAQEQGAAAARGMLGQDKPYDPIPWFWSDQFGQNIQVVGFPRDGSRCEAPNEVAGALVWTFYRGDDVCGAVGVNAARAIRQLKKSMQADMAASR